MTNQNYKKTKQRRKEYYHSLRKMTKEEMIARFPDPDSCIEYVIEQSKRESGFMAKKSIITYKSTLKTIIKNLEKAGSPVMPWEITADDVFAYLDDMKARKLSVNTMKSYISILRCYCEIFDNFEAVQPKYNWPKGKRNVKWLSRPEAATIIKELKGPLETGVVHCELAMGMRRIEVVRLTVLDIDFRNREVSVNGKGHEGGKMRTVPFHVGEGFENSNGVFKDWLSYRNNMVESVKMNNPDAKIPDELFIYRKGDNLYSYADKGSGIDGIITRIKNRIDPNMDLSNHVFRRTFGRLLWKGHVKPEVIMTLLGHESVKTTIDYLGIDEFDLHNNINKLSFGIQDDEDYVGAV